MTIKTFAILLGENLCIVNIWLGPRTVHYIERFYCTSNTLHRSTTPSPGHPVTIELRKGSMITARINQRQKVTHNSSIFKRLRVPDGEQADTDQNLGFDLRGESSEQRDGFEPSDVIVTKDKPLQIKPVVHPEQPPTSGECGSRTAYHSHIYPHSKSTYTVNQ